MTRRVWLTVRTSAAALGLVCLLGMPARADAAPIAPFPSGGQYVMGPGGTIDFLQTDGADTYLLQYIFPVLHYTSASNVNLDADGLADDYSVMWSITANMCLSKNGSLLNCGAIAYASSAASTILGESAGPVILTDITALPLSGTDFLGPAFLRESPTLPSLGQINDVNSFFDLFLETAPNGPANGWLPSSNGPARFTLEQAATGPAAVPEPTFLLLFGTGAGAIARTVRRRRNPRTKR